MNKEQKTIIQIYAAMMAALIMNFIPSSAVQIFGSILFLIVFIAIYVYRARSEADSLIANHMTFLIVTIWITSFLLLIGIGGAVFFADHSIIEGVMNDAHNGIMPTEDQLHMVMIDYLQINLVVFAATLGPSFIYMLYRLARGAERAINGYRLAKPKGWF